MSDGFLLSRVLLRFDEETRIMIHDLSAAALTPEGNLWFGSDEGTSIVRLSPQETNIYGNPKSFDLWDYVQLFNHETEIDIEGMSYDDPFLWVSGSHSTRRKKPKHKNSSKQLQKLTQVQQERNRYILARLPIHEGEVIKSLTADDQKELRAAVLRKTEDSNILIDALRDDEHLGPYLSFPLPSKENGFDIEGIAAYGNKIMLGFRGPVLRGWATIVEIEVEETEPGILDLKPVGKKGKSCKKRFLHLDGLGIRELCRQGEDLLILAGPTMDLDGTMRIYRLKNAFDLEEDSLHSLEIGKRLETLYEIPYRLGADRAEGLTLYPCLNFKEALMVVYDAPAKERMPDKNSVYGDVFQLG